MEKLLSVVVPTYNVEKYLAQCLDSLCMKDTKGKMEVLLINDGSTDSSEDIAPRIYQEVSRDISPCQ